MQLFSPVQIAPLLEMISHKFRFSPWKITRLANLEPRCSRFSLLVQETKRRRRVEASRTRRPPVGDQTLPPHAAYAYGVTLFSTWPCLATPAGPLLTVVLAFTSPSTSRAPGHGMSLLVPDRPYLDICTKPVAGMLASLVCTLLAAVTGRDASD